MQKASKSAGKCAAAMSRASSSSATSREVCSSRSSKLEWSYTRHQLKSERQAGQGEISQGSRRENPRDSPGLARIRA